MSGRKHHYLPQLVQRPFACRRQGKEFYVYAHHRIRGRFSPNISGLGKELDFYGGPEDASLDAAITRGEDALARTVRAINSGGAAPSADLATLICALAFRTKSMREALVGMLPAIFTGLRIKLLDPVRLRQDLMASLTDPKQRKRLIYEQIDKTMGPVSREQRAKAYGLLLPRWKAEVAKREEQLVAEAWHLVYEVLTKVRSEAAVIADGAYLKALAKDPAMPLRASRMATSFVFEVIDSPPGEFFILGDCGPVAMFTDGKPRLVMGAFADDIEIEAVFLPTSPVRCIVARLPTSATRLSVADINRFSASLSLEFFISDRENGGDLDALRASIGSLTPIETEEDIVRSLLHEQD